MTDFKSQGVRLWKRLHASPAGSLPGGMMTNVAVVAGAVVVLLFLTFYVFLGGGEDAAGALPGANAPAQTGGDFTGALQNDIEQQERQAEMERQAAERNARNAMREGLIAGQVGTLDAEIEAAGPNPETGLPYTEAEYQLREALRLEAMERRIRSLRSAPVAQSYRGTGAGAADGATRQDTGGAGDAAASSQEAIAAAQEAEVNRLRDTFTRRRSGQLQAVPRSGTGIRTGERGQPGPRSGKRSVAGHGSGGHRLDRIADRIQREHRGVGDRAACLRALDSVGDVAVLFRALARDGRVVP